MAIGDNITLLSGSTNGRPISIVATSSPGTVIHTVPSDTSGILYHQVFLYAANIDGAGSHTLTLQLGGTTTDDQIVIPIGANSGPILVLDGKNLLNGGVTIRAYANAANKINVWGYANVATRAIQGRP